MRSYLYTTWLVFAGWLLIIQGCATPYALQKERADQYREQLNYTLALRLYKAVNRDTLWPAALEGMAECYLQQRNWKAAAKPLQQLVQLQQPKAELLLQYATVLHRLGQTSEAKEWYQKYVETVPGDTRAQQRLIGLEQMQELQQGQQGFYQVNAWKWNSKQDEMHVLYMHDSLLVTANKHFLGGIMPHQAQDDARFLGSYLWTPTRVDSTGKKVKIKSPKYIAAGPLPWKGHTGFYCQPEPGIQIFNKSRNSGVLGKPRTMALYERMRKGKNWTTGKLLSFQDAQFNYLHPTNSPGGDRLIFASDMAGGYGGYDLYEVRKINGVWTDPVNLGAGINTEGNELYPWYDPRGRLWFASDGWPGLGGLDLYTSADNGQGQFNQPENPGAPINSDADDFGLCYSDDGIRGMLVSDRKGGKGGYDLYEFTKNAQALEIQVKDKRSGQPLANARVQTKDGKSKYLSGKDGKIQVDLPLGQCPVYQANAKGYFPAEQEICAGAIATEKKFQTILLEEQPVFAMEGLVTDASTGRLIKGATLSISNDCAEPAQQVQSKADGTFFAPLLSGCCFTVTVNAPEFASQKLPPVCTRGKKDQAPFMIQAALQPQFTWFDVAGIVVDANTAAPIANATIRVQNDCGITEQTLVTNAEGVFTVRLPGHCCFNGVISVDGYSTTISGNWCKDVADPDRLYQVIVELR